MDIGLIVAVQPFDKSTKRLAPQADTFRLGYCQSEALITSPPGRATILTDRMGAYNGTHFCIGSKPGHALTQQVFSASARNGHAEGRA
jgi:hypothetical protein